MSHKILINKIKRLRYQNGNKVRYYLEAERERKRKRQGDTDGETETEKDQG